MVLSALVRRCRSAAPLVAFTATALLAIVLAAQAQLVCSHEMIVAMPAISMPGMAGMEMPPASSVTNALALCPIVLILGIAAAVLCANALALIIFDPHRSTTGRTLARRISRLSLTTTATTLLALGSTAVGIMMAIDRSTPTGVTGWLLLAGIVVGIAVAASVIAAGTARCALALTRRLAVAIAYVFAALAPPVPVPVYARHDLGARTAHRVPALAARRGLRAPPHTVR